MSYAVGSLVKARGREWVVLPESSNPLLILRPLGGTDEEVTGIHSGLEEVESAHFDLPDPSQVGDHRSCRLLRNAVRLGFRSSAGPFRSFARIAVEPRPYQLVPLMMALKLDPVRLLIADDVGIGKTIEACLAARELLDRGEANRLAVLCPPQLASQWQSELRKWFHIEAELVLSSTARRLERNCLMGQSLFDLYPYVIVSTDFIKSDQRRDEFVRTCPDLVIIDEAHTCAYGAAGRGGKHQRFEMVKRLTAKNDRHMIFVTATPHSGNEEAFRSLLSFLNADFAHLPPDLAGPGNEHHRRTLAAHFVQRRRSDIRRYLDTDTPFPEREEAEESYKLSDEYKKLFDKVLKYARETVSGEQKGQHRQRVRWWSALALLRSLASSPAAAAETLRNRAASAATETPEEADAIGREAVLDLNDDEISERSDVAPGCDVGNMTADESANRRRLRDMATLADTLQGDKDEKLIKAVNLVDSLLKDGHSPILFCRFIPTAEYVAEELRKRLKQKAEVSAVTGTLPPAEREDRIEQLAKHSKRVLVCTDCLSEGINLQDKFDAVVHYDLSWNPTRHEQREGRVDRYGQPKQVVRALTYYGIDNQIDGIVLDVLIRKHKTIRTSLGYSVPVPVNSDQVIEAVFEGMLLREDAGAAPQAYLPGLDEYFKPQKEELYAQWDNATDKEKRSRKTMFAQEAIKTEEVARELEQVQSAIGSRVDVASFVKQAFQAHKAVVSGNGTTHFNLVEVPRSLRESVGIDDDELTARFESTGDDNSIYLSRTHPIVEGLASYIMDTSLDPIADGVSHRSGAIRTKRIEQRTTVLLVRFRYHIITRQGTDEKTLLAEECRVLAFTGSPANAQWLNDQQAEFIMQAEPDQNIMPEQASSFVEKVIEEFDQIRPHLEETAVEHGKELLDAHQRVRKATRSKSISYRVEPKLPPDVLGIYIFLPVTQGD
ncbi:MAG: DEAD/DEAH box helicase [Planctomycetes bacterium]|nr:DEAD/DEAH box helicase [Planctomycetota bacterium]